MKRLTVWDELNQYWQENHDNDTRHWKNGSRECMAKLGAYENTGLEPEDIKMLMSLAVKTETTDPLTIEELQALSNTPIWVSIIRKGEQWAPWKDQWCVWDGDIAEIPGCDHWWYELKDYGETWTAYRYQQGVNK